MRAEGLGTYCLLTLIRKVACAVENAAKKFESNVTDCALVFEGGGYRAEMLHGYNDSLYNDTPNASPSNVSVPISSACLEDGTEVLMDQEQGNVLNEQGVATFIRSGDFVVWGNETCCYPKNTDPKDAFLCVRRFFNHSWTSFVLDNMSKLDKPMNKKRLQSIIDSENMKGSVYVSTEVCASYSMKADPDRNTTAELVAGHYSFYQFCTPFPPFKQINNTMEYEAGALTSALSL